MSKAATRKAANDQLHALCTAGYYDAIPLSAMFDAARNVGEPVQEDGEPWAGFLCGREGRASIDLRDSKLCLQVQWYAMPSGRFEVNAYVS